MWRGTAFVASLDRTEAEAWLRAVSLNARLTEAVTPSGDTKSAYIGEVMMPLDAYPFADAFTWLADRFGVNWQVLYAGDAAYPS